MRIIFGIFLAMLCGITARASTILSGTLSITNYSVLTNATSGQSYTINGAAVSRHDG